MHLTIEQAAELVKSSIGDVFSRDAVLSIIGRIKVQESVDMAAVRSMISDHQNSQAYIKGWVSKLKEHKYECVSAMTQAAKAIEYIKQFNK